MKSFFKTLLAAFVFIPVLCVFTACGPQKTADQQTQENYEVLLFAVSKMSQKGSYTLSALGETQESSTTTMWTRASAEAEWTQSGSPTTESDSRKNKEVLTYDATTKQFAHNSYNWVEPVEPETEGNWEKQFGDCEYIVEKSADPVTWVHYLSRMDWDGGQGMYVAKPYAERVSPNHAEHRCSFQNMGAEMMVMISGSTYQDAVDQLALIAPSFSGVMYEIMDYGMSIDDFDVNVVPTLTITKTGNVYKLLVNITISVTPKAEEPDANTQINISGETSLTMDATIKFAVDYTADELVGSGFEITSTSTVTTTTAVSKSEIVSNHSSKDYSTYTYSYTASEMPANFDEYAEAEATMTNAKVSVNYLLDGEYFDGDDFEFGHEFSYAELFGGLYIDMPEHTTLDGWYSDKDCTQKIAETEVFTFESWEFPKFYAKTKADEGFVIVSQNYGFALTVEQAAELNMFEGTNFKAGDLFAEQTVIVAVSVEGSYTLPSGTYELYWTEYDIVKVTDANGTELTEPLTNFEEGTVYVVNIYLTEHVEPLEP